MRVPRVQVGILGSRMDRFYTYIAPDKAIQPGTLVEVPFGNHFQLGVVVKTLAPPVRGKSLKLLYRTFFHHPLFHPFTLALAEWMSQRFFFTLGEVLPLFLPPGIRFHKTMFIGRGKNASPASENELRILNALPSEGFLSLQHLKRVGPPSLSTRFLRQMAKSQKIAIETHFSVQCPQASTEMFPQEIHEGTGYALFWKPEPDEQDFGRVGRVAPGGGQVLILAPEKRLLAFLRHRISEEAFVYHTGIAPQERKRVWRYILEGKPGIYLGSRSIVFASFPHLQEIWIYYEKDDRYEHQKYPRYQADEVAKQIARMRKVPLWLFAPAPSVSTFLQLPDGERPRLIQSLSVRIFSLREKRISFLFTVPLYEELKRLWSSGEKGIFLVGRRGYSSLLCKSCGYFLSCPRCGSSLVLSRERQTIHCRRCSLKEIERASARCPECGSPQLQEKGAGRERVVRELRRLFPHISVYSLDSDVAPTEEQQDRILTEFRRTGNPSALVATPIVLGEELPQDAFRVVLLGEHFWGFPDYSSSEKALFTFLSFFRTQASAYLQTYSPSLYLVRTLQTGNLLNFYDREISLRSRLLFPPFAHLLKISLWGEEMRGLKQESRKIIRWLEHRKEDGIQILGPVDWQSIGRSHQVQILVKTPRWEWLHKLKMEGFLNFLRTLPLRSEVNVDSDSPVEAEREWRF